MFKPTSLLPPKKSLCQVLTRLLFISIPLLLSLHFAQFQVAVKSGLPIPGAPVSFPLGNIAALFQDPNFLVGLGELAQGHKDPHSGLSSVWTMSNQAISVTHMEDISTILSTTTERTLEPSVGKLMGFIIGESSLIALHGEQWNRTRTLVQSAVERAQIGKMLPDIFLASDALAEKLITSGRKLDAVPHVRTMVFDVIGRVTYNQPLTGESEGGLLEAANHLTQELIRRITSPNPVDSMFWVPTPANVRLQAARELFRGSISREIVRRRKLGLAHEDFLQQLLQSPRQGVLESDEQLVDTVASLVFGSTETFSSLFSSLLFTLGQHKDIQQKVYLEATSVFDNYTASFFSSSRQAPSFCIQCLKYTNAVVKETLRLYAPAPLIQRTLTTPFLKQQKRGEPLVIPKGTNVWIPIFHAQRDPHNFEKPLEFIPERFTSAPAPYHHHPASPDLAAASHSGCPFAARLAAKTASFASSAPSASVTSSASSAAPSPTMISSSFNASLTNSSFPSNTSSSITTTTSSMPANASASSPSSSLQAAAPPPATSNPPLIFPFSGGRRDCVASRFAETLATVILARIISQAEVVTVWEKGQPHVPFSNGFTQFPAEGVPLIARTRARVA